MKSKSEFIAFLAAISDEMGKSKAEYNPTTEGFLNGLSRWLEDTKENGPKEFDWKFTAQLIRAGIFYE